MSTNTTKNYHHGDLQATLLATAMRMLERGEEFSLRAVARKAGVSQTAPYRHYADRAALESALAAQGFRDLKADLLGDNKAPMSVARLGDFAVAYVAFALRRPTLFRLMFGNKCDDTNDERVRATAELHTLLAVALARVFPDADAPALATAAWGLVHGLAFLHLDGKLAAGNPAETSARVRGALMAILSVGAKGR
ncbi:MAG: WHG domain-containing protein [Kofleriaceae bacterium]